MNVLVTGAFQLNSGEREQLEAAGHKVFIHGDERAPVDYPERYEAVVCNGLFLYNSIERFTSLRLIQLTSAGLDRVPLDDIRARGIELHNAAGVYSVPMAVSYTHLSSGTGSNLGSSMKSSFPYERENIIKSNQLVKKVPPMLLARQVFDSLQILRSPQLYGQRAADRTGADIALQIAQRKPDRLDRLRDIRDGACFRDLRALGPQGRQPAARGQGRDEKGCLLYTSFSGDEPVEQAAFFNELQSASCIDPLQNDPLKFRDFFWSAKFCITLELTIISLKKRIGAIL